jgi:hypothetical protein
MIYSNLINDSIVIIEKRNIKGQNLETLACSVMQITKLEIP